MQQKPRLSFWQIWNMSFGFFGIQFAFGLQQANMSNIFKNLGAATDDIPILWLAAPLTGLIVQPIIGSMSDRTWNRLGRRRPFFLVGAILSAFALFFMPNSSAVWMAVLFLWLLDASVNIRPRQREKQLFSRMEVLLGAHRCGYLIRAEYIYLQKCFFKE